MIRKELIDKLELVKPSLSDQNMVPIFTNFVFNDGTIYGYNDQIAIVAPVDINAKFAVHGTTLLGFLKNSRTSEVQFSIEDEDLLVRAGKSKLTLPYFDEEDFLFNEPEDAWDVETIINDDIIEGIKLCLITSSQDFAYPALMGVTLKIDRNMNLYSCDGDTISRYFIKKLKEEVDEKSYTMPNSFCNSLIKIRIKTNSKKGKIFINNEWVKAELDNGYIIYGRIIEKDDPLDHEELIRKTLKSNPSYVKIPKGFMHAISRARVVADPESDKTKLTIKNNKIRLKTETNIGNVNDVLRVKGKHPDVEAFINASMVHRSIDICEELSIMGNCSCYRNNKKFFQVLANMDS